MNVLFFEDYLVKPQDYNRKNLAEQKKFGKKMSLKWSAEFSVT
jgi:hypothetical protein